MKIDPRREELWQKLKAELLKHGLEVTFQAGDFDTRDFKLCVSYIGKKQEARLRLPLGCLDDWRQNKIDTAIAAAKKALKP
jgi:hypothetical protein